MKEAWRPVVGFEKFYEVSNFGRVRRLGRVVTARNGKTWRLNARFLAGSKNADGYVLVHIGGKVTYIHSLVAEAFIGPRPVGCQIAHADGRRDNNKLRNLSYKTKIQNAAGKRKHGTNRRGSKIFLSKLVGRDILVIRKKHKQGFSNVAIAKIYNLTPSAVGKIVRRQSWRHVC